MRLARPLGWGLLTVLIPAAAAAQTMTYRTTAIPIGRALEQLSKQSAVRLSASAELENEPIILKLAGADANEAKSRIAACMGGGVAKNERRWAGAFQVAGAGGFPSTGQAL